MRYLTIGYYTICLSPLLSLFLLFSVPRFMTEIPEHLSLWLQLLVINVQVCGIVLYSVGYLQREYAGMQIYRQHPFIQLVGILLILWGLLTAFWADWQFGLYEQRMRIYFPDEPISSWHTLGYMTMVLKGVIWVVSGLVFVVSSLIQTKTHFTCTLASNLSPITKRLSGCRSRRGRAERMSC